MSGHSKWHNIRVRKGAADAKRGKVYTKYARLIEIAAREGGGDAGTNVRLRALIDGAKSESVPNANIDRAIAKGTGQLKGAAAMEEFTYEAYGPSGSAFIIECLSDNKNRALSSVKLALTKNGGRFAENGSVMWMFERKGVVMGKRQAGSEKRLEELELELIDFGAEDIAEDGEQIRVVTAMNDWSQIRDFLAKNGYQIESAGLQYVAKQTAPVDEVTMEKVHTVMEALEEVDDVSEVHTNAILS
ncbi:MAG: YebC/PmpR family DNA-binding transcriptional regulator [Candidatus Peribacteraceae bacterium]|nr:YebC/PmpR family DNA-binding transcriptional regulator [Candidatus Peribacteraceae bacterium]